MQMQPGSVTLGWHTLPTPPPSHPPPDLTPTWMGVPLMMTRSAQGSASSALRSCMRGFFSLWPSSGGVRCGGRGGR